MIGIKCCCCAARAQLERHYGIAIMMHHLARCISALVGEASAVQSAIIPALSPHKGQKQRLCVGAAYYCHSRQPTALQPGKTLQTRRIILPPPSFDAIRLHSDPPFHRRCKSQNVRFLLWFVF